MSTCNHRLHLQTLGSQPIMPKNLPDHCSPPHLIILCIQVQLIAHPHLLVRATSERLLPAWGTFKVGLTSESHGLQPMLVLTIYW
jgi:hypothetical protein